jgi:uncharacterized membrane protein required for colicin V production
VTYSSLGWLVVIIIALLLVPYVLNYLNKKIFKTKNTNYMKSIKFFRNLQATRHSYIDNCTYTRIYGAWGL